MIPRVDDTRQRLIAAASELFAERGFHATTARDIAQRAGVNLAAGHYHYGSKKELYLEVLREQFGRIGQFFERYGGNKPPQELARFSRRRVQEVLQRRITLMLGELIGPPPGIHGALMQREMADPSQALPVIVEEFIKPMSAQMQRIIARLAPHLSASEVRRCVFSVIGQVVFYRFAMPALLRVHGFEKYPPGFAAELAEHIATFSVGGMERVAARRKRRARAR